jgi:pyruvate,orthophosphate dikinase
MDTILNLGLCEDTLPGLSNGGHERFAWDSYRRLIQMLGDVVLGIDHDLFEHRLEECLHEAGATVDSQLLPEHLKQLVGRYRVLVRERTGQPFPDDPSEQLRRAIDAVFRSWDNPRAQTYRRLNEIKGLKGTAVTVQAMVFVNRSESSATGVCFTRNPSTGENTFYGEFLQNAQGEDVVAGIRTPRPIDEIDTVLPGMLGKLLEIKTRLEAHFREMQDLEFTVEDGRLYVLQTRTGKRTGPAAVRVAVDLQREGLIDEDTAVLRVDPAALDQLLHPNFDDAARTRVIATGLPASPGAAVGQVVFTAAAAEEAAREGRDAILVRAETSPEDIGGMYSAQGILTARGGMTSHAAVVARGMGKPCVVGAESLVVDEAGGRVTGSGRTVGAGEWVSFDGSSGEIFSGVMEPHPSEIQRVLVDRSLPRKKSPVFTQFSTLMRWADEFRRLRVRTNADTPHDSNVGRAFGAEGIGLCRTEHMFFGEDRITAVRHLILADDPAERRAALGKLLPMQRRDFVGIYRAMDGLPVTIRLLDPPLHEFLPVSEAQFRKVAREMRVPVKALRDRAAQLHESNPMLGHRGCRLGITFPEIYDMQVRAILEAAIACKKKKIRVLPEIMIPLVGAAREIAELCGRVRRVAGEVEKRAGTTVRYQVGTMMEIPRACLVADSIAKEAEFFSFGTNDLTQMTYGFSRDDVGKFLPAYLEERVLDADPFQTVDQVGVGRLMQMAVEEGRTARAAMKIGVCGEHGGDPQSVAFFHRVGLDYVSCSPYRVPVARLAAAHAQLAQDGRSGSGTA